MSKKKKIDAGFYDEEYYRNKGYTLKQQYETFHELAGHLKGHFNPRSVLDVGCSIGVLVKAFRDLGIESYGVDFSEYAVSHAPREVRPFLSRVDVDREKLPFEEGRFDLITMLEVLEHLHDHRHLIREARRVLRDGGGVFVTTPLESSPWEPSHINIHPRKFWVEEFENFGFRYARDVAHSFPPVMGASRLLTKVGIIGSWALSLARRLLEPIERTYAPLIFVKE